MTRSFKYRGALNAVLRRTAEGAAGPLVTASAGNHGVALATAAAAAGVALRVFVPRTAPRAKVDRMRLPGVTIDDASHDYDEAERRALAHAGTGQATYVSPYNDVDVIAGAGTVALEVLDELPQTATLIVPTGGGGLLSGIALAAGPDVRTVGIEPAVNQAFGTALQAGRITPITPGDSLADGLVGNLEPDAMTFDLVRRYAHDVRAVDEAAIAEGVRALFHAERLVAEGAGGIGIGALVAGLLDDLPDPLVVVVSGANIDATVFAHVVSV